MPVTLSTGLNPLDVYNEGNGGKPWPYHVNVYELRSATRRRKISRRKRYGPIARAELDLRISPSSFPTEKGNRGHLHTDTAEAGSSCLGAAMGVRRRREDAVIARQGDIVYAVPGTFHSPQFWGKEGLNCRLTNSTMPSLNHLYDAPK